MHEILKTTMSDRGQSPFHRWWNGLDLLQKRMIRMCLSMLVMILCFPLYYLGFFGSVDGPLHPARIGDTLAGMGTTRTHMAMLFLSILIMAVSWNWIYNWASLKTGARLTCKRKTDAEGTPCGEAVRREKVIGKKTGMATYRYVCVHGHKRRDAHFHPVKKGAVSHSLWAISLCFAMIVLFT